MIQKGRQVRGYNFAMRKARLPLLALLLALLSLSGTMSPPELPPAQIFPLRAFFREGREILLVYPQGAGHYAEAARRLQDGLRHRFPAKVQPVADDQLSTGQFQDGVVVAGIPRQEGGLRELYTPLQKRLPLQFGPGAFRFAGTWYRDPEDLLLFFYPNPFRPSVPALFITGNSDARVAASLGDRSIFHELQHYNLFRGRRVLRRGGFTRRWTYDPRQDDDWEQQRVDFYGRLRAVDTPHYAVHYPPGLAPDPALRALAEDRERRLQAMARTLGKPEPPAKLHLYLYPDHESKGRLTQRTAGVHWDASTRSIHLVYDPERLEWSSYADAALLLDALGLHSNIEALERGLPIYLSGGWHGRSPASWLVRLERARALPPLEMLWSTPGFQSLSYRIAYPVSAALVQWLVEEQGLAGFLESFRASSLRPEQLAPRWESYVRKKGPSLDPGNRPVTTGPVHAHSSFHRGMSYAHTVSLTRGYLSRKSRQSLARLAELGVNWVSLMPFGFQKEPADTTIAWFGSGSGTSSAGETDESVIQAHRDAHLLGMGTLLKPQLWLRQAWTGDIAPASEAGWKRWFSSYEQFILHYALLADEEGVDMLCIGTELVQATLTHPAEWRQLIGKIRHLYRGPLTYAANWGHEFEEMSFWDELDFLGLDNYYPIANGAGDNLDQLVRGAEKSAQAIEGVQQRFGKPVLFTEVGFRSAVGSGTGRVGNQARVDLRRQAECFEAIFRVFWDRPWFRGAYWWKWFSDPTHGNPRDDDFTFRGKPAEKVLADWYGRARSPL
ncbi:MAG: hypothetical protein HY652_00890 [Acidobacteria bacterium]|nr:hypothetical protein [Acidobacteriota bacterium]